MRRCRYEIPEPYCVRVDVISLVHGVMWHFDLICDYVELLAPEGGDPQESRDRMVVPVTLQVRLKEEGFDALLEVLSAQGIDTAPFPEGKIPQGAAPVGAPRINPPSQPTTTSPAWPMRRVLVRPRAARRYRPLNSAVLQNRLVKVTQGVPALRIPLPQRKAASPRNIPRRGRLTYELDSRDLSSPLAYAAALVPAIRPKRMLRTTEMPHSG